MKENGTTNYKQYMQLSFSENVIGLLIKSVEELERTSRDETLIWEIKQTLKKFETEETCPRCGEKLYLADVEGYDYVCYECDENF